MVLPVGWPVGCSPYQASASIPWISNSCQHPVEVDLARPEFVHWQHCRGTRRHIAHAATALTMPKAQSFKVVLSPAGKPWWCSWCFWVLWHIQPPKKHILKIKECGFVCWNVMPWIIVFSVLCRYAWKYKRWNHQPVVLAVGEQCLFGFEWLKVQQTTSTAMLLVVGKINMGEGLYISTLHLLLTFNFHGGQPTLRIFETWGLKFPDLCEKHKLSRQRPLGLVPPKKDVFPSSTWCHAMVHNVHSIILTIMTPFVAHVSAKMEYMLIPLHIHLCTYMQMQTFTCKFVYSLYSVYSYTYYHIYILTCW